MIGSFKIEQVNAVIFGLILFFDLFFGINYVVIPLGVLVTVLSFVEWQQDKTELKEALCYARVEMKKFKISRIIFLIIIVAIGVLFLVYFLDVYKMNKNPIFPFIVFPTVIPTFLGQRYVNFVRSIRSFENGIRLPGRSEKVILWSEIELLTLHGREVEFRSLNGKNQQFSIKETDLDDMQQIILQFQQSTTYQKK